MVYREGFTLALVGVIAGAIAAAQATQLLQNLLYGTQTADPLTLAAAAAMTLVITLLAVITPAVRAARVDPVMALRAE
jgi:ABC-type antimicrobial peptide transport system permease subunit